MKDITNNKKGRRHIGKILFLAVIVILIGIIGFSCVEGLTAIGWSGGAVSGENLYVGTEQGRLVAINLTDKSRLSAEELSVGGASGGLFGCMPAAGGGCGGGSGVAIYGTPTFSDEFVHIAGYNGKVYAYTQDTLAERWRYPRDYYLPPIVGGVVFYEDKVFFGTSDGKINGKDFGGAVFALDAATGDPLWASPFFTEEKIWSTPAVADGAVYIGSTDKNVYAVNTADGSRKWVFATEGAVTATPLVVDGTVYIGSHDRHLYAINATNGTMKWSFKGENWFWAKPVLYQGKLYAGCLDGKVYVLDPDTGNMLDDFDLEGPLAADPVMYEDNIIFCTREGKLFSINTTTNLFNWDVTLDEEDIKVNGPLAIYDGVIYIHTQDKKLRQVNADTGVVFPDPISLSIGE